MNNDKPFAPSADRNKDAILNILRTELYAGESVLEYGSGTGQHACHFATALTEILWQPTDVADKLPGLQRWIDDSDCSNILPPFELDLSQSDQTIQDHSNCYSANTLHIVPVDLINKLFSHAAATLPDNGKLIIYGPYRFHGKHISEGNRSFDRQLRDEGFGSGIRDIDDLNGIAAENRFSTARVIPMPANNHILIWTRQSD